jgi:hypothetical protein
MTEVALEELRKAVEGLHHCKAAHMFSERVLEEFRGEKVWEGLVHQFAISGHPTAKTCYAWSSEVPGSSNRQFYAVLKLGPVQTARDAVRASIVQTHREGGGDHAR